MNCFFSFAPWELTSFSTPWYDTQNDPAMLPEFTQEHYKICFNKKKNLSEHTNCIEFMKKKIRLKIFTYLKNPNGGLLWGLPARWDSSGPAVERWPVHTESSSQQIYFVPFCIKINIKSFSLVLFTVYLRMSNKTPAGIVVITSKSFDLVVCLNYSSN